jgi:hypothetical protein
MTIANVSLANTFDQWRVVTNQLVVLGNSITENSVLRFVTNSASLLITPRANIGEIVSINVGLSNVVTDNSSSNIAAAGSVNTTYTLATQALTVAQAAYGNANTKIANTGGTINGDLIVSGNVSIFGGTFRTADSLIYLAANNYTSALLGDSLNIGVVGNYVNSGAINVHTGMYRNSVVKEWYLFKEYSLEPGSNNNIDPSLGNFQLDMLNANIRTSNIIYAGVVLGNLALTLANTSSALTNTFNVLTATTNVRGNINASGYISTTANASIGTFLSTASNASIGTYLSTASNVSIGTSITVGSYANVAANLSVGTNLNAAGYIRSSQNATVGTFLVTGANTTVGSNLYVTSNATVGTFASIGSYLVTVANAAIGTFATIGSYLSTTANASIGTYLSTGSNATVGTSLVVGSYANVAANLSVGTYITDSIGNVRSQPINNQTSVYALQKSDAGKIIVIGSGTTNVFLPNAVFSSGDVFKVFNYGLGNKTLSINTNVLAIQANGYGLVGGGVGLTGVNRTFSGNAIITISCIAGVGAGTSLAGNTFVIEAANSSIY